MLHDLLSLQVAELKMELKLRSLPVSGTKTDLIERLKLYQENSNIQTAGCTETAAATAGSQSESMKLTPPVSPIALKVSTLGIEDSSAADALAKVRSDSSPQRTTNEECPAETKSNERDSEKDKRLHEKERQIEELMRKLEQEQKLVEELKMQLEVEKRSQHGDSPPQFSPLLPVQVKEEYRAQSNCSVSCSSPPGLPVLVKQEEPADQSHVTSPYPFMSSHQTITEPAEPVQPVQAGAAVLLPASLPASAITVQLPAKVIKLHTTVSSAAPSLTQTSGQVPQKTEDSAGLQQQCSSQIQPLTKVMKHLQQTASIHRLISHHHQL